MVKVASKSKYFEYLEAQGKLPKPSPEEDALLYEYEDELEEDIDESEDLSAQFINKTVKSNDSSFAQALMKSR